MAIIDNLALSKGGGVISLNQQAEQAENVVSVIIGLGGTGIDCIRELKTQIYSRVKPDNYGSTAVARYDHIKFIGVDADNGKVSEDDSEEKKQGENLTLASEEMFPLAGSDVSVAKTPGIQSVHPEYAWVSKELETLALKGAGAGGIRQVGRFMMMSKSDDFMQKLRNTINEGKVGLTSPEVAVHIFAGLGGGTGSGTFLDVCYMVREVLKDEANAYISGYFFLPDVNVAHVKSQIVKDFIPVNGYAAMQELDYCMNLENNKGSFKQVYKGRKEIEWKLPPVDFCHLISAVDNSGNVRKDAYSYAMKVASEYVLEFLVKVDPNGFSMKSHIDNANQMSMNKEGVRLRGYYLRYLSIGASSACIPVKEINTYLATQIFNVFQNAGHDTPSETDIINFAISVMGATNAGDDIVVRIYNNLFSVLQGAAVENYIQWDGTAKQMKTNGNQDMVYFYEEQTSNKKGILEKNKLAMLDPRNSQSLINKLQRTMMDVVITNIERGPVFGYNILRGANRYSLDNIIDALVTINSSNLRNLQQYTAGKELTCSKAHNAFDNSNFMNQGSAFKEYVRSEYDVEQQRYKEAAYIKMEEMLRSFKLQVGNIAKDFYGVLARIYTDLRDTFNDNSKILAKGIVVDEIEGFENSLIDINDPNMQAALQNELRKVAPAVVFKLLITSLVTHTDMWKSNATISKLITEFFVGGDETNAAQADQTSGIFKNFADKTIENFLQIVYDTDDIGTIADKIQKNWLGKLAQGAAPLFYQNTQVYNSKLGVLGRLSVPKGALSLRTAADNFLKNKRDIQLAETGTKDRIFFLTSGLGFPISALKGITDSERTYFSTTRDGSHYYEGMPGAINIAFDDWAKLPLLTPASILANDSSSLPELSRTLYDRDMMICAEIERYKLYTLSTKKEFTLLKVKSELDDTMSMLASDIEEYAGKGKSAAVSATQMLAEKDKLKAQIDDIRNKLVNGDMYEASEYSFTLKGMMQGENDVNRLKLDTLCYSPVMLLEAEVNIQKVEQVITDLNALEEKLGSADKMLASLGEKEANSFYDALFAGVIRIDGRRASFTPVEDGYEGDQVFLSSSDEDMSRYNAIAPYQAYLSFQTLDSANKKIMKDMTNSIIDEGERHIRSIAKEIELTATFSDKKFKVWNDRARDNFESEKDDIQKFLKSLKKRYITWCDEYGIDEE